MKKALFIMGLLLTGSISQAQTVAQDTASRVSGTSNADTLLIVAIWVVIAVSVLVLIVAIYALTILKTILLSEKKKETEEKQEVRADKESWFKRLTRNMTDAVPVEQEETVMLDHDYDGIRELDNHLPPWWKWLFYFTIGWAALYLLAFHVFKIFPLSGEEYNRQVARAEEKMKVRKASLAASIDESTVTFSDDPAIIQNGKDIFAKNCVPCHAVDGGGGVGPNLTDQYWIHGGSINDIFRTIKYGVPDKGMITWQTQLSPSEIRDVACYIYTLEGTTPAKPKEPQGEIYKRQEDTQSQANSVNRNDTGKAVDTVMTQ